MTSSVHITEAHASDIGGRKSNQDSLLYTQSLVGGISADGAAPLPVSAHLAVVADGLGGLSHGELASGLVCAAFRLWFDDELPQVLAGDHLHSTAFAETLKASWRRLLAAINLTILNVSADGGSSMGSTVCAALLLEQSGHVSYHVLGVGDTRCYLFDAAGFRQLTRDQTVARRELELGTITADQLESHPGGNVLLQAIGATKALVPDIVSGTVSVGADGTAASGVPGAAVDAAAASAHFLLCSDGFWRGMAKEGSDRLVAQHSHEGLCREIKAMTERFSQESGSDNVTAVALSIEPDEGRGASVIAEAATAARNPVATDAAAATGVPAQTEAGAKVSAATNASDEALSDSGEVTECLR
jgi:serine/threonine protein phosphatase PrpC